MARKGNAMNAAFEELIARAMKATPRMDRDTADPPTEFIWLLTALSAIECGLRLQDWDLIARGFVLLRDLRDNALLSYEKEKK
jgi:hypothetical protein